MVTFNYKRGKTPQIFFQFFIFVLIQQALHRLEMSKAWDIRQSLTISAQGSFYIFKVGKTIKSKLQQRPDRETEY